MIIKMGCGCLHGDGRLFGTLRHTVGCVSYIFLGRENIAIELHKMISIV